MRRRTRLALLGAATWSLLSLPAAASPWNYGERQDPKTGARTALVFSVDIAVNQSIGFACANEKLRAVAMPPPAGATGDVVVSYEIDGAPYAETWRVSGSRIAAEDDAALGFLERVASARSAIWFRIGDSKEKSLHYATGLAEQIIRMREFCKPGS